MFMCGGDNRTLRNELIIDDILLNLRSDGSLHTSQIRQLEKYKK